jgi:hypothetical protein
MLCSVKRGCRLHFSMGAYATPNLLISRSSGATVRDCRATTRIGGFDLTYMASSWSMIEPSFIDQLDGTITHRPQSTLDDWC